MRVENRNRAATCDSKVKAVIEAEDHCETPLITTLRVNLSLETAGSS